MEHDPDYVPEEQVEQAVVQQPKKPFKAGSDDEKRARLIEKIRPARFMYDQSDKDYKRKDKKEAWFESTGQELGMREFLGIDEKFQIRCRFRKFCRIRGQFLLAICSEREGQAHVEERPGHLREDPKAHQGHSQWLCGGRGGADAVAPLQELDVVGAVPRTA